MLIQVIKFRSTIGPTRTRHRNVPEPEVELRDILWLCQLQPLPPLCQVNLRGLPISKVPTAVLEATLNDARAGLANIRELRLSSDTPPEIFDMFARYMPNLSKERFRIGEDEQSESES